MRKRLISPRTLPVGRPVIPELMTMREVADALRCTPQHCYALMRRGEIETVKVGRNRLVARTELAAFIARNTEKVAS